VKKPNRYNDRREWVDPLNRLHRRAGPALEWDDGTKSWHWRNAIVAYDFSTREGHHVDSLPQLQETFPGYGGHAMKWATKPFELTPTRVWRDHNGCFHRSNGPAIEWDNGNKEWWEHGRHVIRKGRQFLPLGGF